MVAALRGFGEAALALPLVSAYRRMPPGAPLHLFFDLQGLSGYESRLPARIASQLLPDRKRVSVEVLVESAATTMGFGIIGDTVGAALDVLTSRDEFRRLLYHRLAEHSSTGFSLDAVNSLSNE